VRKERREVMKYPSVFHLKTLIQHCAHTATEISPGVWIPARPLGMATIPHRFKAAWLVFTGKADAVVWPGGQ
jgi:hypothetical protein